MLTNSLFLPQNTILQIIIFMLTFHKLELRKCHEVGLIPVSDVVPPRASIPALARQWAIMGHHRNWLVICEGRALHANN